jgi:oligoribonuclease NrnB/cAMP/cGMP phosphodiesterase (DHH superfamily)
MDESYFRRVIELDADVIVILDKPLVSSEFLEEAKRRNLPVLWIDHHDSGNLELSSENLFYYNSYSEKEKYGEPVTAICWEISQKKEDIWLSIIGCVSDKYFPSFYSDLSKEFPELSITSKEPFEIFYKSEIGKIGRLLSAGLKDKTTNVVKMLKFMMGVKSPHEVLEESSKNREMHSRFNLIDKKFKKFISKALFEGEASSEVIYFEYGGDMSISADLANYLSFLFPEKEVIVVYISGTKANISGRGKSIKNKILSAIEDLEGATGGGHEDAVGAQVLIEDLKIFHDRLLPSSG